MLTDGRTTDEVITIAHPEQSSGELISPFHHSWNGWGIETLDYFDNTDNVFLCLCVFLKQYDGPPYHCSLSICLHFFQIFGKN